MGEIIAARKAYDEAQQEALRIVRDARLEVGRRIREARERGISQDAIVRELNLTREHVRRFQREYEDANGLPRLKARN